MACRRKVGASTPSATPPTAVAADVDDRELSAAARERAEKKAARPAAVASAAQPIPWGLFVTVLVVLAGVGYLTIKYS